MDSKLMVVVAVLAVIMAGIYVFLYLTDRKITRIEKELRTKGEE